MRTRLTETVKSWFYFVSSKLMPKKHVSTMQKDKAILTYAIVSGMKFNVGAVIENSILELIDGKLITHPSLIIELCLRVGVEISKDEEKIPPMIPLPFPIEKNDRHTKPTIEGEQERRKENLPESKDRESEEDDAKGGHIQSPLENISQRITT